MPGVGPVVLGHRNKKNSENCGVCTESNIFVTCHQHQFAGRISFVTCQHYAALLLVVHSPSGNPCFSTWSRVKLVATAKVTINKKENSWTVFISDAV